MSASDHSSCYFEPLPPPFRPPDYVPDPYPAAAPAARVAPPGAEAGSTPADDTREIVPELPAAASATAPEHAAAKPATLKCTGRISSPVHRVQRPSGLAVSFALTAGDGDAEQMAYRVYATKQFAERLVKQRLEQGSLVEVAGQAQVREEAQPDGSRRPVPYLYCYGVRVLAAPPA